MKYMIFIIILLTLTGCATLGGSGVDGITSSFIEGEFRKHGI